MMTLKTLYIDLDDTLADFTGRFNERIELNPDIKYPQCEYGFFSGLKPIEDSIKYYEKLSNFFDVYILTAPSVLNPMCYTEKRVWVEKHLGIEAANKMIICGYKNLLIGDYLIDDKVHGRGQDKFKGSLIHFQGNWKQTYEDLMSINNYPIIPKIHIGYFVMASHKNVVCGQLGGAGPYLYLNEDAEFLVTEDLGDKARIVLVNYLGKELPSNINGNYIVKKEDLIVI